MASRALRGPVPKLARRSASSLTGATAAVRRDGEVTVVALSGGVDSSVAASLLVDQDRGPVRGVFMKNWDTTDDDDGRMGCEWEEDWEDARSLARKLGIPIELVDLSREYWNRVWDPSLQAWDEGLTPNPDVLCNRHIKFGALAERVFRRHPDGWLATGHYARIETSPDGDGVRLLRALHHRKDQSYYLAMSRPSVLARTLLPLGSLAKHEVRDVARSQGLQSADRPESMGVCFVEPRGRFSQFLGAYLRPSPGDIVDMSGRRIGSHSGLWQYTIGERCRDVSGQAQKMFVASKDVQGNRLVVVPGSSNPALYSAIVQARPFSWLSGQAPVGPELVGGGLSARVRTGDEEAVPCHVTVEGRDPVLTSCLALAKGYLTRDVVTVHLDTPQHGVSPGQVLVLHRGEQILGGGIIRRADSHAVQGDKLVAVHD